MFFVSTRIGQGHKNVIGWCRTNSDRIQLRVVNRTNSSEPNNYNRYVICFSVALTETSDHLCVHTLKHWNIFVFHVQHVAIVCAVFLHLGIRQFVASHLPVRAGWRWPWAGRHPRISQVDPRPKHPPRIGHKWQELPRALVVVQRRTTNKRVHADEFQFMIYFFSSSWRKTRHTREMDRERERERER